MVWWVTLIIWSALFVINELVRPKPKYENAKPAGLGEFNFPTATEGRCIPIIWGRVKVEGPNVVWYGAYSASPITEEVKTGMFSSDTIVVGYRYSVAMQLALCRGEAEYGDYHWINDLSHFQHMSDNTPVLVNWYSDNDDFSFSMTWVFHNGSKTQAVDSYLDSKIPTGIAYRGTCYMLVYGCVGENPHIPTLAFELERYPNTLGATTPYYDYGANPACVVYEIFTDTDWGLSIPISQVDTTNFREVADTLALEGNSFALMLDSELEASELLEEIGRQIDAAIYFDRTAGLWRITLIRDDYDPDILDEFDEGNIAELMDYARTTWDETTNQVRINFTERGRFSHYKDSYALAQDTANFNLQGTNVTAELKYPGVMVAALANKIAWRDLRTLSYPLAKLSFKVNRRGFNLIPGSVFKLSWAKLGISGVVFRVNKIGLGNIDAGQIEVYAVQDVFSTGIGSFSDPTESEWEDIYAAPDPVDSDDTLVFEAPRQLVIQDTYSAGLQPRFWMGARQPAGATKFNTYSRIGASRPLSTSFLTDSVISKFLLVGTLYADIAAYGTDNWPDTSITIQVTDSAPDSLSSLVIAGSGSTVSDLLTILYIDGEFIGYETIVLSGGRYNATKLYRGLFSSCPKAHTAGAKVWFIGQTGGNLTLRPISDANDEIDIQLRSVNLSSEATEAETPITQPPTIQRIWTQPIPPRNPTIQGTFAPTSVSLDTLYTTETGRTGEDASAVKCQVLPRCWRIDNPIQDHILGLSPVPYLDDTPELSFQLVLDPDGTPINVPAIVASDSETPIVYVLRNSIIEAVGANTDIPATGNLVVTPSHLPPTLTARVDGPPMEYPFAITSELIGQELRHGGIVGGDVTSTAVIYGETGTYTFNIYTALPTSGRLQASINSGAWATVIAAGNTTGTLAVTAADSITLRFDNAPAADQFFIVTGPTSESGYGVLLA